ncbi:Fur family transcriptional regulator [Streptantibioticus parmotrematis]|uniref:Fur family transcriptional regulator n=1 Tax=Streptantibioticus parmotrematis TaxID=2873249 RepID=UPI0033E3717E
MGRATNGTPTGPGVRAEETLAHCRELLRGNGGRCTQARLQVVRALWEAGGHLPARAIHERILADGGSLEMSTVYRALERLTAIGIVHSLTTAVAETTYGLIVEPHHHVACRDCGTVVELPAARLAGALADVGELTGFRIDTALFTGRCPRCRN